MWPNNTLGKDKFPNIDRQFQMSIELPPPPSNQGSGGRDAAMVGLGLFAVLSLAAPSYFSPLNAIVPDPYFLRTQLTSAALPFQVGTAMVYCALGSVAVWKNQKELGVLLLVAAPAMALLTFVRLLFAGGLSGGI